MVYSKKYFMIVLFTFLSLMIMKIALSYHVDPFGMYHGKTVVQDNEKIVKPFQLLHQKPEVVYISNSRANYAIDVSKISESPAYNASMSGANMDTITAIFEHAIYVGGIKEAYLGIDRVCDSDKPNDTVDARFLISSPYIHWPLVLNRLTYSMSYQSLLNEISVLRGKKYQKKYH